MNNLVERLVKVAFHRAIQLQNLIDGSFPIKKLKIKHNRKISLAIFAEKWAISQENELP